MEGLSKGFLRFYLLGFRVIWGFGIFRESSEVVSPVLRMWDPNTMLLMIQILHYLKDPELLEFWYIPYYG